ncbi:IclR family transcriptional regulator [Halorussus salinisoli]|uniref:IclR family transcriptional regulator n=1 Tax=Halorussus salinisoli TaxID=2558242 RepID=UPI0010C223AF|nr:IclR family transcriptional regulator [Halorussus salinisoli]
MNGARNPVKAVQNGITILEKLRELDGARVTTLEQNLNLTKGTIHSHLATFEETGFVVKEGDQYQLGLQFLDLARQAQNRYQVLDIVEDEVDRLAMESGEMALFTVEENGQGICLYKAEGEDAVQTEVYVGYRNELYHTAVGKAILAFLPEERRKSIIEQKTLEPITENTITDKARLAEEMSEIREQGFAYNHEETIQGLAGIGAPVKDQQGKVFGAISVIGPTSRMDEQRLEDELPELLAQTVNVIEINATSIRQ